MAEELLDYPKLVEDAMRGVVRQALREVADHGLPGDHHFYISFATTAPGVDIAGVLRAQYPEEMTIVLQRKFWDLAVDDDAFVVSLTFAAVKQRLYVPFAAVTGFVDPSVNFGFKFDDGGVAGEQVEPPPGADSDTDSEPAPHADPAPDTPAGDTGRVVTLDTFRKK